MRPHFVQKRRQNQNPGPGAPGHAAESVARCLLRVRHVDAPPSVALRSSTDSGLSLRRRRLSTVRRAQQRGPVINDPGNYQILVQQPSYHNLYKGEDGHQAAVAWPTTMSTHQDCRMYESKFPEVDDVVMVQVRFKASARAAVRRPARAAAVTRATLRLLQVKSIAEMGAYVSLLEYNGIEGMILLSELSRRRIRSITKLIKVGPRIEHASAGAQVPLENFICLGVTGGAARARHGAARGQRQRLHRLVKEVGACVAVGEHSWRS
jgi:hypothetical protein